MSVASVALPRGISLPAFLGRNIASWTVFLLVAVLVASPLAFLILGSLSTARLPGDITGAGFSLAHFRTVWSDPSLPTIIANTFVYASGATAIGVILAIILAWLVERTDIGFKALIYAAAPMTLAMPGLLQAMAWILLLSPRIGFLNQFLQQVVGFEKPVFNIYSMEAMIIVEGLRLVPTAFLMLVPLLRRMDPMLEEAAATCGASGLSAVRRVTLRLMLPGLLAITIFQFITAIEAFEIPGLIGMPAQLLVFSTKIYLLLMQTASLPVYGQANALAMLYLLVALVGTYFYGRAVSRSEKYSIVTGKGYRPKPHRLGRLRFAASALVWGYIGAAVLLPVAVLAYVSFLPLLQRPSLTAFASFTIANYQEAFTSPLILRIITNTVVMSCVTAIATAILSFAVALVVVRSRFWGRRLLDQLAFAPSAIPGLVLALAFLWIFLQVDKVVQGLFGTIWSVVIAFTVAFLPYGSRAMSAAILQIHRDLEEAGYASGVRQWRVMRRIFLPLMAPALIGVGVWSLLNASRIMGIPVLLYEGTRNQVLAVLMWNMWEQGQLQVVAALGTAMTIVLLGITLALRFFGFGKGMDRN